MSSPRLLGEVVKLKVSCEELKGELTPSFYTVIDDWLGNVRRSPFSDPKHVLEITYPTKSLRDFVKSIVEGLSAPGRVVGVPLERGFGFGKTHALILLWHLLTSDAYKGLSHVDLGVREDLIEDTLVLGFDFSKRDAHPFEQILRELEAYGSGKHSVSGLKNPKLVMAVGDVLGKYRGRLGALSSRDLAEIIASILDEFGRRGGTPRLLLLADEVGFGVVNRVKDYVELVKRGQIHEANRALFEVEEIINFLSHLYDRLIHTAAASVVIWVFANQDRRDLESLRDLNVDNEIIYKKIDGLLKQFDLLAERYSRAVGGVRIVEYAYEPRHALEIAKYRILEFVSGDWPSARDALIKWLRGVASQLGIADALSRVEDKIREFYPFSPGLINLLMKLTNAGDMPGTEYVRTVLNIACLASERALRSDAEGTYVIGLKHLTEVETALTKFTGELIKDQWDQAVGEVINVVSKIEDADVREAAGLVAKYIMAKGITAKVLELLETSDRRVVERYGSTLDEVQLEAAATYARDFSRIVDKLGAALDRLRESSGRVEEREVGGRRFYLPTIYATLYHKLYLFIAGERERAGIAEGGRGAEQIPIYIRQSMVPTLFSSIKLTIDGRGDDVVVTIMEYDKVKNIENLLSDQTFRQAQNEGKLLLVVVPPWDSTLFSEIYVEGKSYDGISNSIANSLQAVLNRGGLERHLHLLILLPDLSKRNIDDLLSKLVIYEGSRRFLREYLPNFERILSERLSEIERIVHKQIEHERIVHKRGDIMRYLEELRSRGREVLRSKLEREVEEVKRYAQGRVVKLSREVVSAVVNLYRKVIHYSVDESSFVAKDVAELAMGVAREAPEHADADALARSISMYAPIVNRFFVEIIRSLGYRTDPMEIVVAVLERYRKDLERGSISNEVKLEDEVENIMRGTYRVKPLSLGIAVDAVKRLNNQIVEAADKVARLAVEVRREAGGSISGVLKIETKPKAPPPQGLEEGALPTPPPRLPTMPERVLDTVHLSLPAGFNVEDLYARLRAFRELLSRVGSEVRLFRVELESEAMSVRLELRRFSDEELGRVKPIVNFVSRLISEGYAKGRVSVEISLSNPVAEDNVREVFGSYFAPARSSFDRFLPS